MGGGDGEVEEEEMETVLIAVVVFKAIKVLLFPEALYVSVVHGSISVTPTTSDRVFLDRPIIHPKPVLQFDYSLRIDNPRRSTIMYYLDVTVHLFDNNTPASSSNPDYDSLVYFHQFDTVVPPQREVEDIFHVRTTNRSFEPVFFDLLYHNKNGDSMSGITMRLEGTLVVTDTEKSRNSNTSRPVTYYCWPLVIQPSFAAAAEDLGDDEDVFCREAHKGNRFI